MRIHSRIFLLSCKNDVSFLPLLYIIVIELAFFIGGKMKKITKLFLYVIFLSFALALVTSCGANKPKPTDTNSGNQSQQTKTPDKT